MAFPSYNPNIVAQALARLTTPFQQPNIRAWCAAIMAQAQDLENATWGVLLGRMLSQATVETLPATNPVFDSIGALVGQPRSGLSDSDYKAMIYLRVAVNRARGVVADWSGFAQILLNRTGAGGPIYYLDQEATILFGCWDMALNPSLVGQLLAQAAPNGVGGSFLYTTWTDGNDFEFDDISTGSPLGGEGGYEDAIAGGVGGTLVSAVQL
jgi:hypothetical protein